MSEPRYEYTGVKLPRDAKKKVRLIAADNETSIAEMALRLLMLGLQAYEKGETLDSISAPAPAAQVP